MRLSHAVQHVFMVERGWSHRALNDMDETEFLHWYDEAIALAQARAEAREAAQGQ